MMRIELDQGKRISGIDSTCRHKIVGFLSNPEVFARRSFRWEFFDPILDKLYNFN